MELTTMNENEINQIIDFINTKYDKDVPGPVKFVVKRKVKKIQKLDLDEFPESFRKCTVEEFILILKEAHEKNLLKF